MESKIAPGYDKARAVGTELDVTENGNDVVIVHLQLDNGASVSSFLHFSEKAAPYSIEKLRALGWPGGDSLANLPDEATVQVKYETYQGTERMKVEIQGRGRVAAKNPPTEAHKREFLKRLSRDMNGGAPPAKPAPASRGGYPPSWDTEPKF
jgi:hypothetical protein